MSAPNAEVIAYKVILKTGKEIEVRTTERPQTQFDPNSRTAYFYFGGYSMECGVYPVEQVDVIHPIYK